MESPVTVEVKGLTGPLCTVEATREWSTEQVRAEIAKKYVLEARPSRLILLNGTERLAPEALVGSLLRESSMGPLELSLVIHQAPQGLVDFDRRACGVEQVKPGYLRKAGGATWQGTAISAESFEVGEGRGLRFRPGQVDKAFAIGLGSHKALAANCEGIDYLACFYHGGAFSIYEDGFEIYESSTRYSPSTWVEIRLGEKVEYYLNGELQLTSELRGQEAFYAMATFYHNGAEALEIQWL